MVNEPEWAARAEALAGRTHELIQFLCDVLQVNGILGKYQSITTYHDGCSGLRELGIKEQPRALLGRVADLVVRESPKAEACCGFGGTVCVKYPEISAHIVDEKVDDIAATGADTVIAGDLGCLLNIAGRLQRRGLAVKAYHIAEVLAGSTGRAIGEP